MPEFITKNIMEAELKKQGFTKTTVNAFVNTANNTNCIISSRVPGEVCTDLIDQGYDLKGYFIKSKSCNWGPMAGFLCQLPPFNKNGCDGIESNAKSITKTYNTFNHYNAYLEKHNTPPNNDMEKTLAQKKESVNFNESVTPFIALYLNDARVTQLLVDQDKFGILVSKHVEGDTVIGIAFNQKKNVFTEFKLYRVTVNNAKLWKVLHGRVFTVKEPNNVEDYLQKIDGSFPYYDDKSKNTTALEAIVQKSVFNGTCSAEIPVDHSEIVSKLPEALKSKFSKGTITFKPVLGISNNFRPYSSNGSPNRNGTAAQTEYYKNAVTGDYDLFAAWPHNDLSVDGCNRESEKAAFPNKVKPLALKKGKVHVEVIPSYDALENLRYEDPRWGNINNYVHECAATVNSLCDKSSSQSNPLSAATITSPNMAFHSDEGGRPGIDELDLPVAFFIPDSQPKAVLVKTRLEFLELLETFHSTYQLFIHLAWVYDLLNDEDTLDRTKDLLNIQNPNLQALKDLLDGARATRPQDDKNAADIALQ